MLQRLFYALTFLVIIQAAFTAEDFQCYQCDSATDPNCISNLKEVKPGKCEEGEAYCLTSIDSSGIVKRNCSAEVCDDKSTTPCVAGSKDVSNSNDQNICQNCDSSKDIKCAQSEDIELKFNEICKASASKCLIKIENKITQRRCVANDDEEKSCTADTKTCKVCDGGNCNHGIFPSDRRRCYQCSGTTCTDDTKSLPCKFYDSQDKCYMFATSGTTITRGCITDDGEANRCAVPETNELCMACDSDNCNNVSYMHDQSLKCIQCNPSSSATDTADAEKCLWGQDASEAKNCKNQIEYYKQEGCYTEMKDNVVQRGCIYDRATDSGECKSDAGCETCDKDNGCNNIDRANFTCIICRSDLNAKCNEKATEIEGTKCRNPVKLEDSGCFYGKWRGVVIRGCLIDADEQVQAVCKDENNKVCSSCAKKDCNSPKPSGANGSLSMSNTILCPLMAIFSLLARKEF